MGVLGSIFKAILGPVLIYFILIAHVVFQVGFKENEPLQAPEWPAGTNKADKDAVIAARKPILHDFMDFVGGKNGDFFKKHATEDIVWEDPVERFTGIEEVDGFARVATRWIKSTEFQIHAANHAPHEVVFDWTLTTTLSILPSFPMTLRLRTHILMETSGEKVDGKLVPVGGKVFKIFEEWGGNPLLNEKSFSPAIIGKVHSNLRKFAGYMITQAIKYGIL